MKNNKKTILILLISIILLALLVLIGFTYAKIIPMVENTGSSINTGNISFTYTESKNGLSLEGEDAISDAEGMISDDYLSFSVSANSSKQSDLTYYIYFTLDNTNTLPTSAVKLYLSKVDNANDTVANEKPVNDPILMSSMQPFDISTLQTVQSSSNYLILSNEFSLLSNQTQTHNFRLRLWLDENYNINNDINTTNIENGKHISLTSKTFKIKVNVISENTKIKLPQEYQQVEYIESNRTQYIDTGIIPTDEAKIVMDFSRNETNGSLFGTAGNGRFQVVISSINTLGCRVFTAKSESYILLSGLTMKDYTKYNLVFDVKNLSVYVDGIEKDPLINDHTYANNNLYLFANNLRNSIEGTMSGKIYFYKYYDNDILLQKLIPCYRKSDGEIGMYDVVNNEFYTNTGTGNFTKGSDII